MAQVPYSGVPEVAPSAKPPDDYNRPDVRVGAFGGHIAQGLERFGQGASQAGKFFGQVSADNAANDFQDQANKILHGDPNRMVDGPDGKPTPDLGYLGTRGRASLDTRPGVEKQLDELLKKTREGLTTSEQQLQFDNISRRYRSYATGQIGTHADNQANSWYRDVNSSSAKLALDHISGNPDNAKELAAGASDLIQAYTKQAQLMGAQPGDEVWRQAEANARRDALTARVEAIGVKDPARAADIVDKNKDFLGTKYDDLANKLRTRADGQRGDDAAGRALAAPRVSAFPQPVEDAIGRAAQATGEDANVLKRFAMIESGGDPNAVKGSYRGLFQMSQSEFLKYGPENGNIFNPDDNAMAAANKMKAEKLSFQEKYGRPATPADLYLIHQQGAGGYAAHMANPDGLAWQNMLSTGEGQAISEGRQRYQNQTGPDAAQAWARAAIWGNVPLQMRNQFGSVDNITSRDFVGLWAAKVNNGQTMVMEATKAARQSAAYKLAMDDPAIKDNPRAMQHALSTINQRITAQTIAEEHTDKARKEANDQAADGYVKRMLSGNFDGLVDDITKDPNLNFHTREALGNAALRKSGQDEQQATQAYGPGFWSAYKSVIAGVNDPSKISDPALLLQRAGPGGDLTLDGVQKLMQAMGQSAKSIDGHSVNTAKVGLMTYAKSKLSFEQDTGPIKIRDPKGEAIFNAQFIPKFEAAYDQWVKGGKDPYEFLTRDNIDKMVAGMRNQAEMRLEKMRAEGTAAPEDEKKQGELPPAPATVKPENWTAVMGMRPTTENGTRFPATKWAEAVQMLLDNPSKETFDLFNNSSFGKAGYKAEDIVDKARGAHKPKEGDGGPGLLSRAGSFVGTLIERERQKAIANESRFAEPP